jgi:hypothetical protein
MGHLKSSSSTPIAAFATVVASPIVIISIAYYPCTRGPFSPCTYGTSLLAAVLCRPKRHVNVGSATILCSLFLTSKQPIMCTPYCCTSLYMQIFSILQVMDPHPAVAPRRSQHLHVPCHTHNGTHSATHFQSRIPFPFTKKTSNVSYKYKNVNPNPLILTMDHRCGFREGSCWCPCYQFICTTLISPERTQTMPHKSLFKTSILSHYINTIAPFPLPKIQKFYNFYYWPLAKARLCPSVTAFSGRRVNSTRWSSSSAHQRLWLMGVPLV